MAEVPLVHRRGYARGRGREECMWVQRQRAESRVLSIDQPTSSVALHLGSTDWPHSSLLPLPLPPVPQGHCYYGAFGSHTSMVIRRLRRLCHYYGSDPTFIVASATIANPQHHAQLLLGVPHVHLVDQDGSPHGPKTYVMWNPPLRNPPVVPIQPTEAARGGPQSVVGGLPAGPAASLPPEAASDLTGRQTDLSHRATETGVAKTRPKVSPGVQISAAELELAKQAIASVQATGSSCFSGRGSAAPGPQSTSVPPGETTTPCLLWTSSGSRKLTTGSGASIGSGSDPSGIRLQQLRREVEQRMPCPREWSARMRVEAETRRDDPSRRLSPVVEVSMLLAQCIQHGLRTIAFCKSRKMCELVATYTRERLAAAAPQLLGLFKVITGADWGKPETQRKMGRRGEVTEQGEMTGAQYLCLCMALSTRSPHHHIFIECAPLPLPTASGIPGRLLSRRASLHRGGAFLWPPDRGGSHQRS